MKENSFDLEFTPPRNYYELRRQQILDLKLNNFNAITQNESISKGYAQKTFLGWNDEQIRANREWLRKDASLQHEIANIQEGGSDWNSGAGGSTGETAGSIDQGEGTPPDFGPTPGDTGGASGDTGGDEQPADTPSPTPPPEA